MTAGGAREPAAIPQWLSGYLDRVGVERISRAIALAEARTSGEIVPMIVHRSTHAGHVRWILFFAFLSVFVGLVPSVSSRFAELPFWAWEGVAVTLAIAFAWPLARLDFFQRLCTPEVDQDASVLMRAELEFFESNIKKTHGKTGVLIFVSWLEHEAVVLADEAISQKLPKEAWQGVIDVLLKGVRRKDFAGGMCDAIQAAGELLQAHFPKGPEDRDELPNQLIIEE